MKRGSENPNWRGGVSRDNMRYKRLQRERYPERVYARELVRRAVRAGRLVPQPCSVCGGPNANGHHTDYSKPLDVVWMCSNCHRGEHDANPMPRYTPPDPPARFVWRGKVRRW